MIVKAECHLYVQDNLKLGGYHTSTFQNQPTAFIVKSPYAQNKLDQM